MSLRANSFAARLRMAFDQMLHALGMSSKQFWVTAGCVMGLWAMLSMSVAYLFAGENWGLFWRYNVARIETAVGAGHISMLKMRGLYPFQIVRDASGSYHETFWFLLPMAIILGFALTAVLGSFLFRYLKAKSDELAEVKLLRGASVVSVDALLKKLAKYPKKAGPYYLEVEVQEPVSKTWQERNRERYQRVAAEAVNAWHEYQMDKSKREFARKAVAIARCAGDVASVWVRKKIYIPDTLAQRNFLFTGGMGSGKSQGIFSLCDQACARGRTMVFYDKVTEFAELYFRPGTNDVILQVFDERFPGWTMANEVKTIPDALQLFQAIIPPKAGEDADKAYFKNNARRLGTDLMIRSIEAGERTNAEFFAKLTWDIPRLYEFLKGTLAGEMINPDNPSGAGEGGFLSTLRDACAFLEYTPDGPFSIRDWVRAGGDRRMFVTSHQTMHETTLPMSRLILTVATATMMSGKRSQEDLSWIIIDELRSLESYPMLAKSCTEARKFGVVHLIGMQDTGQARLMFGKDEASSILGNLQNQVILRVSDADTQENYSKLIGDAEVDEVSQGLSVSNSDTRDNETFNVSRQTKRAVMASEIGLLDDCEGYMTIAGSFPWCKIKYVPHGRSNAHGAVEGLVERSGLEVRALSKEELAERRARYDQKDDGEEASTADGAGLSKDKAEASAADEAAQVVKAQLAQLLRKPKARVRSM